jgi:hypothetical protein
LGSHVMKVRLADGSGTIELKYLLEEQLPSGGVRIRFRRKGSATITLSAPLGSDEFMKEIVLRSRVTQSPSTSNPQAGNRQLSEHYAG